MYLTQEHIARILRSEPSGDALAVLADNLEEQGDERAAKVREAAGKFSEDEYWWQHYVFPEVVDLFVPAQISGHDWHEAFGYAGEAGADPNSNGSIPDRALPNDDISIEPFSRIDVKRVIASADGERDGPHWVIIGELWDGRFFALSAGCDYTGWD